MDPRVVTVLRRLAEIESGTSIGTTFLGGGRSETVTRQHAEVTELLPEQGIVEIRHGDEVARLHFDEAVLLEFIAAAAESGEDAWGEPLPAEESAARFLSVHLDESLGTREPHESGWWTYRAGGFDPLPPWEAHARRRHQA
ncbi:hypothetical protein [Blastococcus haudaquaticus]|uniref:Uncharacterized protein n=1 Tax=Blastococcus haudaquaticus TaxID=1938745 RepID=A0A286GCY2_9ACTN|nr:hypothetical protein [Blastococcus haudaquaticus]SOD93395.1 hypothetical protein SAMN06272739_0283 [Blastococcus haudaquaticus]